MDHHSDNCEVNLTVKALSFVINIVGQLDTDDAERVWPECVYLFRSSLYSSTDHLKMNDIVHFKTLRDPYLSYSK